MNLHRLVFLIIIPFSFYIEALKGQPSGRLVELFQKQFKTHYSPNRCGDNILGFLSRAQKMGLSIDLGTAHILEISNKGFSQFGMVSAEYAREGGRINPNALQDGFRLLPGELNWEAAHVILEVEGHIFDFDFGNGPKVLLKKQYFEKMFLADKRKSEGGTYYTGREEKLKSYEVKAYPALETLKAVQLKKRYPMAITLRLGIYLQ